MRSKWEKSWISKYKGYRWVGCSQSRRQIGNDSVHYDFCGNYRDDAHGACQINAFAKQEIEGETNFTVVVLVDVFIGNGREARYRYEYKLHQSTTLNSFVESVKRRASAFVRQRRVMD